MTDHYTDGIFKPCARKNDFVLDFQFSRLLIDLERFQNDAEEPMGPWYGYDLHSHAQQWKTTRKYKI